MPVRITPFRAAVHLQWLAPGSVPAPDCTRPLSRRLFHGTPTLRDDIDDKNHYETLSVKTNASPADIKKSFYTLSKTYHPDHNRADPHASRRFMRISEAYNVLSHSTSRAKYDRDVLRLHESHPAAAAATPRGSYSSTGPAGGRPASGLSRRRGTFRGPPPSFYRSGGWGAHGAKRSAAHDDSTGSGSGASSSSSSSSAHREERPEGSGYYTSYNTGGMGPGQEPFGRGTATGEVPHFDRSAKEAHTRMHDNFRQRRMRREGGFPFPSASSDFSDAGTFFLVLLVLGVAVGIPYVAIAVVGSQDGSKKKKKSGE
ncbi:hypothetical protein N0V82_001744 [Gnomoniopsis sp. IMI 355080]|nr:hypothetical protein N0V82_001744 [Gnomoniopsis sp. IMI 355080]